MPATLTKQEIDSKTDPSVSKQYDTDVSFEESLKDFYSISDGLKIGILGTLRPGVGPVGRAMAVAKRSGPDFLFLANGHSQKFTDLEKVKDVNVSFHNSTTQDWISVTGEAVTTSNDDPRIKEVYSKATSAWFGDLGDGVHTGGPEDPRMRLIEIRAKYISYWKHNTNPLGFMKEIGVATMTGGVAVTGLLRELKEAEINKAREQDGNLSKSKSEL
nr:hypothetical protein B0A51_02919 [Rachicladosporium sp. CCFEE 5018]